MSTAMIVDDHPLIRMAVRMALQEERYDVIAECGDGVEAMQSIRQQVPDLILLDIGMPKLDGLAVIRRVRTLGYSCKILVLTSQSAQCYSARCMKAGANGFLSKTDGATELRQALRAVMSGFIYFPCLSGQPLAGGESSTTEQALIERLSNRELAILQHLARGYSNKEIGDLMLLSNKTISTYKTRLIDKLQIKSVVNLAEFAKRNSLA
ncbi:MAG: response regulator [Pseudomonas sp.]|uniref:response regulator n=1 Tax=Pseudomonas sp. TaxID=306 RepID=UPI003D11A954